MAIYTLKNSMLLIPVGETEAQRSRGPQGHQAIHQKRFVCSFLSQEIKIHKSKENNIQTSRIDKC